MTDAAASGGILPEQAAKERAVGLALLLDCGMLTALIVVGTLGGSLTIIAECIRAVLMNAIEGFALVIMRRIHRGKLTGMEFGTGKLEQAANLVIGVGMMGGAIWIAFGAVSMVTGERPLGTPFGLAAAAIIGSLNAYLNLIAWLAVRRAAHADRSLLMQGQLRARSVKLGSSLFVQVTMTIAALSTDHVIVTWADATGALFVACFLSFNAVEMLRAGIPDIIDRSAGKAIRAGIERALARHAGAFERLHRVRSRRAGDVVFVEVALGFDSRLTVAEIDLRIEALRAALRQEIGEADISIVASGRPA